MVKSWVSMADLIQVPGIRGQFAEQMIKAGVLSVKQLAVQDAHELMENISDAYELTQQNSEVAAKGNRYCSRPNIDMITVWIDAAKKLNEAQSEQEKNHFVSANDTSIHEVQTIPAEDHIKMEKEMNVDAEKQSVLASESPLIINDEVGEEMNHRDNSTDTAHSIAEMTSEEDIVKEEAMTTDSEIQYLPVSELILTDRDRANQETNDRDTRKIPSTPDAAVTLVENDIVINKETKADVKMQYLSISESILINNVQAEQETNHVDKANNTSIPTVAMILTEDVGDSSTDLRDYAIEEIRGIGKRSAERLQEINIETTLQLLKQAHASATVVEISRYINEKESLVRAWVSTADLMRVPGIRGQFAEQLVLSGVLSVKQLAAENAQELTAKNLEVNAKDDRYFAKPSIDMIAVWIEAAKDLNEGL